MKSINPKNSILDFFFFLPPKNDRILYYEKIQLICIYAISVIIIAVTAINIYKVIGDGEFLVAVLGVFFILLVLAALVLFWVKRNLLLTQRVISIVVLLMMVLIFWNGGGRFGLAALYFLAAFGIFFLILDPKTGMVLPVFYFIGMTLRILLGSFARDSIFFLPELRERFILVLGISCLFGMIGSYSIKLLVNHLAKLAFTDHITGLPNLEKFKESFRSLAHHYHLNQKELILIGIKALHIDKINAIHGIEFSNNLLVRISKRLESQNFSLLARWSSSIFMFVLPGAPLNTIRKRITDILKSLQLPYPLNGQKTTIHFNAAISTYPSDSPIPSEIQKHILTLLECQKMIPGEVIFYDEERLKKEQYRFSLREALNQAEISTDFRLAYQPKIRLKDNQCIGAEVLIRWDRVNVGPVSPVEFIPIAEESGSIRVMTQWIIKSTFKRIRSISDKLLAEYQEKDYTFSINLSVIDLKDAEFIPFLIEELYQHQIKAENVEFEVTERIQIDVDPQIQYALEQLQRLGFKLSIDDFGTGYSSLSYLHTMKVHTIKIDKSFIKMIQPSNENQSYPVIDAIISLCKSMGLNLIAEGIETSYQKEYLLKRECEYGQGWLYSKAISWEDFTAKYF